jgi:hypothetical protein
VETFLLFYPVQSSTLCCLSTPFLK